MEPTNKRARSSSGDSLKAHAKKAEKVSTILYSYWRSSCSWRVRIALNLKKISYDYHAVHLVKDGGEQLKDHYITVNPSKEVPALVIDGHTISQSTAIIEYLEETRGDVHPLLPSDPFARAQIRRICEIISSDIQPVQNLRVLKKYTGTLKGMNDEEKEKARVEWGKHFITLGFQALEKVLKGTAGKYSYGDAITMADLYIPGQVYNANRFGVDMSQFPIIEEVNTNLHKLKAFSDAVPEEQPDAA